jgi:hypothetical protein
MKYSIISSMYDDDKKKVVQKTTQVNEENEIVSEEILETPQENSEYVVENFLVPSHKIHIIDGVEYLVTPEGKKFAIWALLGK